MRCYGFISDESCIGDKVLNLSSNSGIVIVCSVVTHFAYTCILYLIKYLLHTYYEQKFYSVPVVVSKTTINENFNEDNVTLTLV